MCFRANQNHRIFLGIDVHVHFFDQGLDVFNPLILDSVGQCAKEVLVITHPLR